MDSVFWEDALGRSALVQGTNEQGEMCTEGSKVKALRVVMLLRHEMIEREDVIFCDSRWGHVLDACTNSWHHQVRLANVTWKYEGQQG